MNKSYYADQLQRCHKVSLQLKNIDVYKTMLSFHPHDFKESYCFYFAYYGSHNRLVAVHAQHGATKHKGLTPKRKPLVFSGFMNQRRG